MVIFSECHWHTFLWSDTGNTYDIFYSDLMLLIDLYILWAFFPILFLSRQVLQWLVILLGSCFPWYCIVLSVIWRDSKLLFFLNSFKCHLFLRGLNLPKLLEQVYYWYACIALFLAVIRRTSEKVSFLLVDLRYTETKISFLWKKFLFIYVLSLVLIKMADILNSLTNGIFIENQLWVKCYSSLLSQMVKNLPAM